MKKVFFVVLLLLASCGEVVPPGTVVIKLTTEGQVERIPHGVFKAYGRDRIYFVDTKLASFTESMKILCADEINMEVDVKWVGSFDTSSDKKAETIKDKVPAKRTERGDLKGFQLDLNQFYETAMRDIIRSNSRSIVSQYRTDDIRSNRKVIENAIKKNVITRFEMLNYPVKTTDIMVSNLDYDEVITKQRQEIKKAELEDAKQAALAKARISQARRNDEIAMEEGKAQITRATTQAKANRIISSSITKEVLAMKQWEVLEKMATGPNNELIVVPYEAVNASTLDSVLTRRSIRGNK